MEFFDKKEEVIDLQLTQYGKFLLSLGKLKPVYYAFYDNNIIYDSEYAGFVEGQNATEGRIQDDTPAVKALHNFHSIEDNIARAVRMKNSGDLDLAQLTLQQTPEKSQVLIDPLANSDLATDKVPAWNISLLSGKILTGSTTSTMTLSSAGTILNIPQIEVEVKYTVKIKDSNTLTESELREFQNQVSDNLPISLVASGEIADANNIIEFFDVRVFNDGTYFTIDKDDLVFQIIEENVPQGNDNFEIELFEIEDIDGNGKIQNTSEVTEIKQLRLLVEPDLLVNGVLMDEAEGNMLPVSKIDSSFADYYFDIETDGEIDASIICKLIKNGDKDLYKFARKDFECPDIEPNYQFLSPYSQKESEEECEDNK